MKEEIPVKIVTAAMFSVGEARTIERALPTLDSHDVLVKILACNICTSEYGAFNGNRSRPMPLVFGHEWAGEIVQKGEKVKRLNIGDYVASGYEFDPYSEPSLEGRTGECPSVLGANIENSDGTFGNPGCAQYTVVSEVMLHKMNKDLEPSEAAFLEPLGTVANGFRHLQPDSSDVIVIIGAGTMGLLNALYAKAKGYNVIISEIMKNKIEVARSYGLNVIDANVEDPVKRVLELTEGKGADVVIPAVGNTFAYTQALEMAKEKRAKLLLFAAGYPSPKLDIDANTIHYRRMKIVGCYGADYMDFSEAANLLNFGRINVKTLIEAKFDLINIQKALEDSIVPGKYRVSVICNKQEEI